MLLTSMPPAVVIRNKSVPGGYLVNLLANEIGSDQNGRFHHPGDKNPRHTDRQNLAELNAWFWSTI